MKLSRRRKLFAHQVGLCALCEEAMDLDIPWPDPDSVTVDHVKPASLGGTTASYNSQLVHKRCNEAKADTPPWERIDEPCG